MWNMKSTTLFIASLVAVIVISISMANADDKVKPSDFINSVANVPNAVGNHVKNEWVEIKEYQANSFAKMKKKWPWNQIFKSKNDTQN